MRHLALVLLLAGCGSESSDDPGLLGVDLAGAQELSGTISQDTLLSGAAHLAASVTIATGATVTLAPGTVVTLDAGAAIVVNGSLVANGSDSARVKIFPSVNGTFHGGLIIKKGGQVNLHFTTISGAEVPLTCNAGAVSCLADHTEIVKYDGAAMDIDCPATFSYLTVDSGGSDGINSRLVAGERLTVTDSTFHLTGGDSIIVNGAGDLSFDHNRVSGNGGTTTDAAGQHCACHFNSTGTFLVSYNDFSGSVVGFMASRMNDKTKINFNNFENDAAYYDVASVGVGINPGADLTNNYWGGKAPPPLMGNSRTTPYQTTPVANTGPR